MHHATYTQDVYGGNFFVNIILMPFASDKFSLLMRFFSTIPLGKSLHLQIWLLILEESIKAPSRLLLT